MTRGQRGAHRMIWAALGLVLLAAAGHALFVLRARWSETEAIREGAAP